MRRRECPKNVTLRGQGVQKKKHARRGINFHKEVGIVSKNVGRRGEKLEGGRGIMTFKETVSSCLVVTSAMIKKHDNIFDRSLFHGG